MNHPLDSDFDTGMSSVSFVKRKAPPAVDKRYPAPDPADPFAPLWKLRNRPSTSSGDLRRIHDGDISFELYADKGVLSTKSHHVLSRTPPPVSSTVAFPSPDVYTLPKRIDSFVNPVSRHGNASDSDSSTDLEPVVVLPRAKTEPIKWPSTASRMTKFFPKIRTNFTPKPSPPRSPDLPTKRIHKESISSPTNFRHLTYKDKPPIPHGAASLVNSHAHDQDSHFSPFRSTVPADAPIPTQSARTHPPSPSHSTSKSLKRLSSSPASLSTISSLNLPSRHVSKLPISQSMPNDITFPTRSELRTITPSSTTPVIRRNSLRTSPQPSLSRPCYSQLPRRPFTAPTLTTKVTEWSLPTLSQLGFAAELPVIGETGLPVRFASLFEDRRTVVIFIRHFWCHLCQDYMASLASLARPETMLHESFSKSSGRQRFQLVVIGNGSHTLIAKYKQMFDFPFTIYTDPSLALYTALGMEQANAKKKLRPRMNMEKGGIVDGGYTRHGLLGGIAMVVARALKVGMPVWEHGGDLSQLGGEFVLGPGLQCSFAHRMQGIKGHAPVKDVLEAAGVCKVITKPEVHLSPPPKVLRPPTPGQGNRDRNFRPARRCSLPEGIGSLGKTTFELPSKEGFLSSPSFGWMSNEEEAAWMAARSRNLELLKQKKSVRRAFGGRCESGNCPPVAEVDEERRNSESSESSGATRNSNESNSSNPHYELDDRDSS